MYIYIIMKNYTSTIPANKSIANIEKFLAKNGALNISKHFNTEGDVISLYFQISIENKILPFKLPVNVDSCFKILKAQKKNSLTQIQQRNLYEQAHRTVWKLLFEWIQIQMAFIEMKQVEFLEIFLSYVSTESGTFYEKIKKDNFNILRIE